MADFSEWGAQESGARLFQQDSVKGITSLIDAQHTLGEIAMQPARQKLYEARAADYQAKADANQRYLQALQARQQQSALLANQPNANPTDEINRQLTDMTLAAADAGDMTRAAKGANVLSLNTERVAQGKAAEANALRYGAIAAREKAERIGALASSSTDQTSHTIMLINARQQGMDVSNIPENYEDAKPILKTLSDQAIKARDKADLEIRNSVEQQREAEADDRYYQNQVNNRLRQRRLDLADQREQRLAKAGGGTKPPASPTPDEQLHAKDLLKSLAGVDDAGAAFAIAAEAKARLRANPALTDIDMATRRVIQDHKDAGDFQTADGILGFGKKTTFNRDGTPGQPSELPVKNGKVDEAALKPNTVYKNAKGQTALWTGSKMVPVGGIPSSSVYSGSGGGRGSTADDGMDDEDDGDDDD